MQGDRGRPPAPAPLRFGGAGPVTAVGPPGSFVRILSRAFGGSRLAAAAASGSRVRSRRAAAARSGSFVRLVRSGSVVPRPSPIAGGPVPVMAERVGLAPAVDRAVGVVATGSQHD